MHFDSEVEPKKKTIVANLVLKKAADSQPIRLMPSRSDYATFARTTAIAMGQPVRNEYKNKPNTLLLSLLNLSAY